MPYSPAPVPAGLPKGGEVLWDRILHTPISDIFKGVGFILLMLLIGLLVIYIGRKLNDDDYQGRRWYK